MKLTLRFPKYSQFPYERRLATLELQELIGGRWKIQGDSVKLEAPKSVSPDRLARLTYFSKVEFETRRIVTPIQALLEASAEGLSAPGELRRQSTRYSAHGIHEYKGKFNPQIVRAIANLARLEPKMTVWDPFCGSGTVLLESAHQGFGAWGTDRNPLAVEISNAKIDAIRASPKTLASVRSLIQSEIVDRNERATQTKRDSRINKLPSLEYLRCWFPTSVLHQIALILEVIDEIAPTSLRRLFRVFLSDILRNVSWQDPGDLRIRRRKDPKDDYPAVELFHEAIDRGVSRIVAARSQLGRPTERQHAILADSGDRSSLKRIGRSKIDCVIASPPYATALPYIDTQRLSLAVLGLATAREIRRLEAELIGSRELTRSIRDELESRLADCRELPSSVVKACRTLLRAVDHDSDGFRRQNTPCLVYRYLLHMSKVMTNCFASLRSGGTLAFVVGPSRTTLGGDEFRIDTPELLGHIGEHVGFERAQLLSLDAYGRFGMHSRNSIREEKLLILTKG